MGHSRRRKPRERAANHPDECTTHPRSGGVSHDHENEIGRCFAPGRETPPDLILNTVSSGGILTDSLCDVLWNGSVRLRPPPRRAQQPPSLCRQATRTTSVPPR